MKTIRLSRASSKVTTMKLRFSFLIFSSLFIGFVHPGTFDRHGNNGTVSCDTYCASPQWSGVADGSGRVGSCTSAFNTKSKTTTPCGSIPGNLGGPELTCTCKEDAVIKLGNNGTISCEEFCGRSGRTCLSAYNSEKKERTSCTNATGLLAAGQLECSCNNFPISTEAQVNLGSGHHIKSSVRLSSNGSVNGNTQVWTKSAFKGFHGGGVVYFRNSSRDTIGMVEMPTLGVDGDSVPGGISDRDKGWNANIGATTATQTDSIEIEQYRDPKNQIAKRLSDATDLVKKLCPTSIEYTKTGNGDETVSCK